MRNLFSYIPSPSFVLEEGKLLRNLEKLAFVQKEAKVDIILALKAFSYFPVFKQIGDFLPGATASSNNEGKLIRKYMDKKVHMYQVAYNADEFDQVLEMSSHIVFNSINQFERFYPKIDLSKNGQFKLGIRINPAKSKVSTELYNPATVGSRFGMLAKQISKGLPKEITGLHFHNLFEATSFDLEDTLAVIEQKFGHLLTQVSWINMGGGHLITSEDYDIGHLIKILRKWKSKYNHDIILEPGSAIAWKTGFLLSTVLDIHESGDILTAILDISFTAHMPDTLEMPYRPEVRHSQKLESKYAYRLGGVSCLSGDFLQEYYFNEKLRIGDQLIFEDMMHYTTVKTHMFNGVNHPDIGILYENGIYQKTKKFSFQDYESRMG